MIVCNVCGTEDWIRVKPGQAADATHVSPNNMTGVVVLPMPQDAVASVAWCRACDPLIRRTP
jgi:hypothetical protein